jgi:integrase
VAQAVDKLTDPACRNAKPQAKPYKLADGRGLYLLVTPTGGRLWRMKYRFAGVEKLLSFGSYPETTLRAARIKRDQARRVLEEGADPGQARRAAKRSRTDAAANAFGDIADEWLSKRKHLAASTHAKVRWVLDDKLLPWLKSRPVSEISPPELLGVLRRIEAAGAHETARKAKEVASGVFRYAIATGRAQRDPTQDLRGALTTARTRHHAAITDPAKVGELLRDIEGYQGTFTVRCALRLAPLVFVRPGELRYAQWQEFDLEAAEWRIPAGRMKMREQHVVPLSNQALQVLRELHPLTRSCDWLFPGVRSRREPMSENTINAALRRLGYDRDQMTGHGFRAMASSLLNELGYAPDVIERQLAHAPRNKVRAAYNRASYLSDRRRMMQAWADHLDGLKASSGQRAAAA